MKQKIMTFVGRMVLPAIAVVSLTCMYSCKKDMHEKDSSASKSNASSLAYAISSDEVGILLDDWWANYAVFKNVNYTNSITPNLEATTHGDYALTMLHYTLNVALVNCDSTYEDETIDSVFYTYSSEVSLKKRDVCTAFDNIKNQIKAKLENTELKEKTINRITLYDISTTDNVLNFEVIFEATGGNLIATKESSTGPNIEAAFFPPNTSIPWASQQSGQGSTYTTNPFFNYWYWLFTGNMPQTVAEKNQGFNMLPPDKPAHKYLSSTQLFWIGSDLQKPGSWLAWPKEYKAVQSPDYLPNGTKTYIEITNTTSTAQDATDQLTSQDVLSCNNPHKDDKDYNLQDASYILSYDQTESDYGLTTTRNLDAAALNFYWFGRIPAATAGYNKKASQISTKLSIAALAVGFYAVTKLVYRVHDNQIFLQTCYSLTCGPNLYSICDHWANYVVDERFSHFTIQKMTPREFLSIFA